MLRAVICKGDPTSHGGKVLEGNELMTTNGRQIAQLGHMTFCPQCKGNFPIIEGLNFHTYAGIGTAVDGMKTACGAKLIATQDAMVIDDGAGITSSATNEGAIAAPASMQTNLGASFCAIDEVSGQPVSGMPYRIVLPDGTTLHGVTDANGQTQPVTGHTPDQIELHWNVSSASNS